MADPAQNLHKDNSERDSREVSSPIKGTSPDMNFIMTRAKVILTDPAGVWEEIQKEDLPPKAVYMRYAMILAAISPVATYLGMVLIGHSIPFTNMTYRWPIIGGFVFTIVSYVMSLAMIAIAAVIIEKLAPKFGASATFADGVRLVAFSATAAYLGGAFSLIPMLSILGIVFSLYSLYTLYKGFTPVTGVPNEKKLWYFLSTLVVTFVSMLIISLVTRTLSPAGLSPSPGGWAVNGTSGTGTPTGAKIDLPGGISIDPAKLGESMKRLEAMMPKDGGQADK